MASNPFLSFIHFLEIDRVLRKTEADRQRLAREIDTLSRETITKHEHLLASKQQLSIVRGSFQTSELELKTLQEREKATRERQELAASSKEYAALTQELISLVDRQQVCEAALFQAWADSETAQKDYEHEERELTAWMQEQATKIDAKKVELAQLSESLSSWQEKLELARSAISQDFLQQYEALKTRSNDPYAPLENNHCSVCYYQVSPNDLITMRHNKFVTCANCYRQLYIPVVL